MQKEKVHFRSAGESGNIYAILAMVKRVLKDKEEFDKLWQKVRQGTYVEALAVIREKVDLIDDDGIY